MTQQYALSPHGTRVLVVDGDRLDTDLSAWWHVDLDVGERTTAVLQSDDPDVRDTLIELALIQQAHAKARTGNARVYWWERIQDTTALLLAIVGERL